MKAVDVLEDLALLGSQQYGMVTTLQAEQAGIPRIWLSRLARQGVLQRLRQGVYALPSAGSDALRESRGAWMAISSKVIGSTGPEADIPVVVSHETAAMVHHLSDLVPGRFEFVYPKQLQTAQPDVTFYKAKLLPEEISWVEGLPVTSIARTVVDLSASYVDLDHLSEVVSNAHRKGMSRDELVLALATRSKREEIPDARGFVDQAISSDVGHNAAPSQGQEGLARFFAERFGFTDEESEGLLQELSPKTRDLLDERLDKRTDAKLR